MAPAPSATPTGPIDPVRPTDDAARALARELIDAAAWAAIGTLDPATGAPMVTRVAVAPEDGRPVTLISELSPHTAALRAHPAASLLLGEPGSRGDPLTHPRLTLQVRATFVARDGGDHPGLRALWLARHPKARLYVDFADFGFVRFAPTGGWLNGGFGRAFRLTTADLLPT